MKQPNIEILHLIPFKQRESGILSLLFVYISKSIFNIVATFII